MTLRLTVGDYSTEFSYKNTAALEGWKNTAARTLLLAETWIKNNRAQIPTVQ